jgi:HEAT repeat protein
MQKMDEVEVPESVPGLIRIVEHDGGSFASYAARSLAHYKDPRGVPALKKTLAEEDDENYRHNILRGLIAFGGLSEVLARALYTATRSNVRSKSAPRPAGRLSPRATSSSTRSGR